MNDFVPDFHHLIILDELLKIVENNKEGSTYRQLFSKVTKTRKDKYQLETTPGNFSKKIKGLVENKYISMLRTHPKTFINVLHSDIKILVDSFFKIRKESQINTTIERNGEIRRELVRL